MVRKTGLTSEHLTKSGFNIKNMIARTSNGHLQASDVHPDLTLLEQSVLGPFSGLAELKLVAGFLASGTVHLAHGFDLIWARTFTIRGVIELVFHGGADVHAGGHSRHAAAHHGLRRHGARGGTGRHWHVTHLEGGSKSESNEFHLLLL